ncbi:uncharacterized protein LOC124492038 [Dermatophagoides farinae]|uniref:uncharacterized protein LOC124492038 n=1 Tax=Dermatophagoides farinae TaxID=6954 RepID=UPI003F5D9371
MNTESIYLAVFISLLTISSARGNFGYGQQYGNQVCDKNVHQRAKEMIRVEMQRSQPVNSGNPPYDSRYPGLTNSYQVNNYTNNRNYLSDQLNDHQCKLMRQAFDDLLINTPLCDPIGSYQFQASSDLIQQARNFLVQHCERNQGWRYAQCFKRREIVECENQYNYLKSRTVDQGRNYARHNNNQPISYELCQAFETFRNCVISQSRSCYTTDLDLLGTYFVDKAHNVAWSCLPSQITTISDSYSRRTDLSYSPNPGSGYYPQPPYGQYPNIPNPNNNPMMATVSPYQTQNQPFPIETIDRAGVGGALSGIHTGTVTVCIERVRPFENSCLDHLIMRQREARYGRSSNDVQRRICCALFRYRDCLSRVVLERCFDNSRVTVDILMGDRNREITQSCRDVTRDQCNTAKQLFVSFNLMVISLITISILNNIFR